MTNSSLGKLLVQNGKRKRRNVFQDMLRFIKGLFKILYNIVTKYLTVQLLTDLLATI